MNVIKVVLNSLSYLFLIGESLKANRNNSLDFVMLDDGDVDCRVTIPEKKGSVLWLFFEDKVGW